MVHSSSDLKKRSSLLFYTILLEVVVFCCWVILFLVLWNAPVEKTGCMICFGPYFSFLMISICILPYILISLVISTIAYFKSSNKEEGLGLLRLNIIFMLMVIPFSWFTYRIVGALYGTPYLIWAVLVLVYAYIYYSFAKGSLKNK